MNKDTNKWLCIGCAETILPFNNEDDEQLFLGNLSELWPPLRHLPQSIAALLELEMLYNPLDLNESENSPLYEIDPDLQILNEMYISNNLLNSDYHISNTFQSRLQSMKVTREACSFFHLNMQNATSSSMAKERQLNAYFKT